MNIRQMKSAPAADMQKENPKERQREEEEKPANDVCQRVCSLKPLNDSITMTIALGDFVTLFV